MAGMDGFGVELKRGDGGSPEVFTAVAEITNLSPPKLSRETYDVTSHSSPGAWRERLGGLKDAGEVSADINYIPSMHDFLVADLDDAEPRNYQIVMPDDDQTTWSAALLITGFETELPHDGQATGTLTFEVSGPPTLS